MARGYCYEITSDLDYIGDLDEWTINEDPSAYGVDYAAKIDDVENRRMYFAARFPGAFSGKKCVDGEDIPTIVITNEIKAKYFQHRLERLKAAVYNMTLEQFSTDYESHGDDDADIYDLRLLIRDTCGDLVYFENEVMPVDDFVRKAEPNKKYYIGNVILIH